MDVAWVEVAPDSFAMAWRRRHLDDGIHKGHCWTSQQWHPCGQRRGSGAWRVSYGFNPRPPAARFSPGQSCLRPLEPRRQWTLARNVMPSLMRRLPLLAGPAASRFQWDRRIVTRLAPPRRRRRRKKPSVIFALAAAIVPATSLRPRSARHRRQVRSHISAEPELAGVPAFGGGHLVGRAISRKIGRLPDQNRVSRRLSLPRWSEIIGGKGFADF